MNAPRATVQWDGRWRLMDQLRFEIGPWAVVVPQGFEFDMASVPRLLWPLIGPHELSPAATALHDHLYDAGGPVSRREADRAFAELAARHQHVAEWRVTAAYLAVRLFGWLYWEG